MLLVGVVGCGFVVGGCDRRGRRQSPDRLVGRLVEAEQRVRQHDREDRQRLVRHAAAVLEPGLAEYVGASNVNIGFNFGNFAIVSQLASGVTTYLQADIQYRVNNGVSTLTDVPVTVVDGRSRIVHIEAEPEFNEQG